MARHEIIDDSTEGIYHCISRCVRRAYLCGFDVLTGKSFDHRKEWVRDRLEFLTSVFAVEVLGYALMSTHAHALLRNRPDIADAWDDAEVARRWLMLHPKRFTEAGAPEEPSAVEIQSILADPQRVKELRSRMRSISWFMKELNEPIARRANKEDDCTGHFWEGRFKATRVEDEGAVLACSIYIDLNPIRAEDAKTPEECVFTGTWERIQASQAQKILEQKSSENDISAQDRAQLTALSMLGGWLAPLRSTPERKGFLSLSLDEYLCLLDATGRELRFGKRGSIPTELKPILERLSINCDGWLRTCRHYGQWFYRVVGSERSFKEAAGRANKKWFKGISAARFAFSF